MRTRSNLIVAMLMSIAASSGCSPPTNFLRGYLRQQIPESRISYFYVNDPVNAEGTGSLPGDIVVTLPSDPNIPPYEGYVISSGDIVAVPAGTYTFNLKYVSHSRTRATIDWVDITQNLEGGKCYKVDGREGLRKPEGTLEKLESAVRGPDWYVTFSVAETNSRSFSFPDNNSIRIWGISGSKYPRWKQIQLNKVTDDLYSSCKKDRRGRHVIPFEVMRRIADERFQDY